MRLIPLCGVHGNSLFAMVDDLDYENIAQFRWRGTEVISKTKYAVRSVHGAPPILMHRHIMGCVPFDGKIIDHIDGNGLNCQRINMRLSNKSENGLNRIGLRRNNKSGIRGVWWHERGSCWLALFETKGKIYRSRHESKESAAAARKAFELHALGRYL